MFTDTMPDEEKAWVLEMNLNLPREHAATLVYNHATQDWRDLIPRIDIPTLIVSGRVSLGRGSPRSGSTNRSRARS